VKRQHIKTVTLNLAMKTELVPQYIELIGIAVADSLTLKSTNRF